jgi:hypothetical protein
MLAPCRICLVAVAMFLAAAVTRADDGSMTADAEATENQVTTLDGLQGVLKTWGLIAPRQTPTQRIEQLINQTEDLRQIEAEWARFWLIEQPPHLTYDRIHGGIQPGY